MTDPQLAKSRRTFLKSTLLITGVAATGYGLNRWVGKDAGIIANHLVGYLQYRDLAKKLGQAYASQDKRYNSMTLEQLTELSLSDIGESREQMTYLGLLDVLEKYRRKVHEDFAAERVAYVDGWVLSETEAHLCLLLHGLDSVQS